MKFGLLFQLQDPPNGDNLPRLYDEIFAEAELAERVGFSAFFVPKHHHLEGKRTTLQHPPSLRKPMA